MTYMAYWGDHDGPNFGDILNGPLLDHYGVNYKHTRDYPAGNLFVIGSVARLASPGSIVVGSGAIRKTEVYNPSVNFRSVRGPRTREMVLKGGGNCPEIYGDPALLLPRIVPAQEKKYKIGCTVHYVHRKPHIIDSLKKSGYHYIDIFNEDPLEVAREISRCEKMISTSLHGIIAAHAYGIPAAHFHFNGKKLHGDGVKFLDHYEAMNLDHSCDRIDNLVFRVGTLPNLNLIENEIKKL